MATFLLALRFFASICYFHPPEGWQQADAKDPAKPVVGFIGKGKAMIPPMINLATEATDVTLKDYVKAVKTLHESDLHVVWRDLGEFAFQGGKGRLGEVCNSTPFGEIKLLQGILLKNGVAYILTGAALKEEFSEHRKAILAALRSLSVFPDLFSAITDPTARETLKKRFDQFASLESEALQKQEWETLQKTLPKEFASLGSYWHTLALEEGRRRIFWTETASSVE